MTAKELREELGNVADHVTVYFEITPDEVYQVETVTMVTGVCDDEIGMNGPSGNGTETFDVMKATACLLG